MSGEKKQHTFTLDDMIKANRLGFKMNIAGLILFLIRRGVTVNEIEAAGDRVLAEGDSDLVNPSLEELGIAAVKTERPKDMGKAIAEMMNGLTSEVLEKYEKMQIKRLTDMENFIKELNNV